jgi:hypothetical protein
MATEAPRQVAGHHVGDHSKQHQEHSDPKNPAVVHSLPARAMIMAAVVLMIMLCLIHSFLVSTSSFRSVGMSLSFYPASCENGRKLERENLRVAECGILRRLKSEIGSQ